ncbi:MAG: hypothetical protein RL488_8 [Actinomycetota bacterium]
MASYYSALETARAGLGLGEDLRALLAAVALQPSIKTEAELASLFATKANLALSAQQLQDLVAVIAAATPAPVAEPEPIAEPVVEEVAEVVEEVVEEDDFDLDEDEEEVAEDSLDEPVTTEVVAAAPAIKPEDDVEPGLNPDDYKVVDIASASSDFLSVTTNDAGLFEVSWPAHEGAVFVLAVGEKRFPDAIESGTDEQIVLSPTTKNSRTFASEYRYVSVFRFDEPGKPGVKVGQGRAIGRLLKFDVEKYPGRIILTWETDDPEATVVIFRSEPNQKLPKVPTSEPERRPANSFLNEVLDIGDAYEYRAHLEWRLNPSLPADTTEKDAKQLRVVVPGAVPRVENFWVQRNPGEDEVSIRVTDITRKGAVLEIYQTMGDPGNSLVARGNTQFTLDEFNDKLFQSQVGAKVNQNPDAVDGVRTYKNVPLLRDGDGVTAATITYTAVTKLGNDVYISKPFVLQIVDDLEVLGLEDFYDYHLMRLEVPTGATEFEVWITDLDKNFEEIVELNPTRKFNRETHYDLFGGLRFENTDLPVTPRKIFVRGTSAFFDGQNNAGQHREFIYPGRVTVRYRVKQEVQKQEAKKGGLFNRNQPATSAPIKEKIEVWVDAPQFGINSKNEQVYLHTLMLQQLKAMDPQFPLIKRDKNSDYFHALAMLNLTEFNANGTYKEVVDQQGQPLMLDRPGRNRFVAYFDDSEDIVTNVFVINEDDEVAMNGNGLDKPGRPDAIPNPTRKLKIAIVGAKASGKTTYVSALLQYLEHQFGPSFGGRLVPKPGDAKALDRSSQLANFVKTGIALDPTDSATNFTDVAIGSSVADPRTTFSYKMLISAASPVGEFEFLDLAGEDLATPQTLSLYKDGLQEADLIIFLFDPLQLPEVRSLLAGTMAMPPSNAADPAIIWENLKEVVGPPETRKNPNQKIAVAISKFDAVSLAMQSGHFTFFETFDSAMAINRDPYATNPNPPSPGAKRDFNTLDGGDINSETKALLRLIGLTVEADLDKDPGGWPEQNVKYFVVSALGQGIKGKTHGLSSFRIGDPIRWALAN